MIRLRRKRGRKTERFTGIHQMPRDERLVAVGSLSDVVPANIHAYVLVVMSDEDIRVSGTGCEHERAVLLTQAVSLAVAGISEHDHGMHQ